MNNKIVIFTLDGCFHCVNLKKELDNISIPFVEIEVNANPHIWSQVVNQTGKDYLPTVFIQKGETNTGPVFVPGEDFENQEEIIEIIKSYYESDE